MQTKWVYFVVGLVAGADFVIGLALMLWSYIKNWDIFK